TASAATAAARQGLPEDQPWGFGMDERLLGRIQSLEGPQVLLEHVAKQRPGGQDLSGIRDATHEPSPVIPAANQEIDRRDPVGALVANGRAVLEARRDDAIGFPGFPLAVAVEIP